MINPAFRVQDANVCLLTAFSDCQSVLELGCGNGDKLAMLHNCDYRLGIDIDAKSIHTARNKYRAHRGMSFIVGDLSNPETHKRLVPCDGILLFDAFEHFDRDVALNLLVLVQQLCRIRLVLFVPIGEVPPGTLDPKAILENPYMRHRSVWEADEIISWGFQVAVWNHVYHHRCAFCTWEPPRALL